MTRNGITTRLAFCMALGAGPVVTAAPQQREAAEGQARPELVEIRKVSALFDAHVINQANEKIAGVEDLILSPEGRPLFAVLSRGGVVGVGAKHIAIPWEALRVQGVNGKFAVNLDMTKQDLEKAPALERDHYQDLMSAEFVGRARAYFQAQADRAGKTAPGADARSTAADAQARRQPISQVIRASKVIGSNVKNPANEGLGKVEELLMDRNDRIAFVIVGRGGVLDIGEKYVPVPWSKVRLNVGRENAAVLAVLDVTVDQLKKAPLVDGDNYATLLGPGFTQQVYRYFGVGGTDRQTKGDRP